MSLLHQIYPGDAIASFIIRVLAEVTMITGVAIFVSRVAAKQNPAMRHGICVCALLGVLAAPITTLGLEQVGWRTFQISLEQDRSDYVPAVIRDVTNLQDASQERTPFWTIERARSAASLIILVWVVGTGGLLVRLSLGARKVGRLRKKCHTIDHPKLHAALGLLRSRGSVPVVPILFTSCLNSPVVVGPRRTTVILPEKLLARLDEQQLSYVLAHELTHVRQNDPLFGLIQRIVEAGYWPHPLVHILNRDLVRSREEVCDNAAIFGTTAPQYANTLLTVALGITQSNAITGTIGLMGKPWRLEERVKGLLDPKRRLTTKMNTRQLILMGVALATGTSMIAGAHIAAAPYPPNPQDKLDLDTHYDAKTHAIVVTQKMTKQPKAVGAKKVTFTYSQAKAPASHTFTIHYKKAGEPVVAKVVSPHEVNGVTTMTVSAADVANSSSGTTIVGQAGKGDIDPASGAVTYSITRDEAKSVRVMGDSKRLTYVISDDTVPDRKKQSGVIYVQSSTAEPKFKIIEDKPGADNLRIQQIKVDDANIVYKLADATSVASGQPHSPIALKVTRAKGITSSTAVTTTARDSGGQTLTVTGISDSDPVVLNSGADGTGKTITIVASGKIEAHRTDDNGGLNIITSSDDKPIVLHGLSKTHVSKGDALADDQVYEIRTNKGSKSKLIYVQTGNQSNHSVKSRGTKVYINGSHITVIGDKIEVIKGKP